MRKYALTAIVTYCFAAGNAQAVDLVSAATVKTEKQLTHYFELKNGIPVVYRNVPHSDIIDVQVAFNRGIKDLRPGRKSLAQWMWSSMPLAAKGYPKEKIFELQEKFSLELGCSGGIEYSTCNLGTLNEYWETGLPLLAAVIKDPEFNKEDIQLTKDRILAELKAAPSDPGRYINELVNDVFYPKGHPYRNTSEEALEEMGTYNRADLVFEHKNNLNAASMQLVVVGSMDQDQLKKSLDQAFGDIQKKKVAQTTVESPSFDKKDNYRFEDRSIPTAYIRAKVTAPGAKHKDATAIRLMFEILSEELGEEIRTRRSLSYAVYSYVIQYSLGIGVLSASTSKPQETLEAMDAVIKKLKTHDYSSQDVEEYKRVFATSYFLTQETHASLGSAIANSIFYFGSADELYEFPQKLEQVTAKDIKRVANDVLVDMRIGVIFDRKEFKDEWAKKLIQSNQKASSH